jgi:7-keto-8-aminopelargonate synthetase-like enzyme
MSATQRFHEVANDALVRISDQLWPGAKLCLVVYQEGKPSLDIVLKDNGISLDEVVSTLRRAGLSIDGHTAYKLDLCDSIAGAMAFGYQNTNHPPEGHWAKRFWDMGRAEGEMREALTAALKLTRENLRACQATIHYAGGFDPAYVNDAQAAMKVADEVLAKYPPLNPA